MKKNGSRIQLNASRKMMLTACTAVAALCPTLGHAELSIMGVLNSRPSYAPAAPTNTAPPITARGSVLQDRLFPRLGTPFATPKLQNDPPSASGPTYAPVYPSSNGPVVPAPKGDGTAFSADEVGYQKELGVITARGNVEIVHEDQILIADTVSFNQAKNLITASGNVQLIQPNGDVTMAEFMEISADMRNGIAKKLVLSLSDRSLITAERATRKKGRFTLAHDATYSPCEKCQDNPDRPLAWNLSAKKILHDAKQKRVEYSDVFFEVYDIPLLYVPYFYHPDPSRKRESGFLTPSYGTRGGLGGFATTPFFVNISDSTDLTIEPTWYYDLNVPHVSLEYRDHMDNGELELNGSYIYAGDTAAVGTSGDSSRGHISGSGEFDINKTWRWGFNANYTSDRTYIRRFGVKHKSINSHLTSDLYVEGFKDRSYSQAIGKIFQDQSSDTTRNLQKKMLGYTYSYVSDPISTGAYVKSDLTAYGIQKRTSSNQSYRLSTNSSYVIPYVSPSGDSITMDANIIAAGYYVSDLSNSNITGTYSGPQGRAVPSLTLEWRKPLTRDLMKGRASEIVEPIVKAKVAPNVGNNYKIPNEDSQDFEFDDNNLFKNNRHAGIDLIDGGHRIDYGLKWGVFGKDGGSSQMFIGQSYRLREDSSYGVNSGLEENLSDIVGNVSIRPNSFIDFLYRYRLDQRDLSLDRSETSFSFGPSSTRLSLNHFYIEGTDSSVYNTRESVSASLGNTLSKNWSSSLYGSYRLNDPKGFVSYGGQLVYKDECTHFYATANRSFSADGDIDPTTNFLFRVELKNLGLFETAY